MSISFADRAKSHTASGRVGGVLVFRLDRDEKSDQLAVETVMAKLMVTMVCPGRQKRIGFMRPSADQPVASLIRVRSSQETQEKASGTLAVIMIQGNADMLRVHADSRPVTTSPVSFL